MRNSPNSSPVSSTCRIEHRPSRLLAAALIVLGALAVLAVHASAMPPLARCVAAGVATGLALHAARRELGRPVEAFVWDADGAAWRGDGGRLQRLADVRLHFRGPLLVLAARDPGGRRIDRVFWPDTIDAATRRELRLRVGPARGGDDPLPSVAA